MKGKILLIMCFAMRATTCGRAQTTENYLGYYDLINQAEAAYFADNYATCTATYDKAFRNYSHPFVKDCFIAAQLAMTKKDSAKSLQYLKLAFDNDMPIRCLQLTKAFSTLSPESSFMKKARKLYLTRKTYPIDKAARDSAYARYYRAQSFKKKEINLTKFLRSSAGNTEYYIHVYLSRGIFPSERMIGIMSDSSFDTYLQEKGLPYLDDRTTIGGKRQYQAFISAESSLDNEAAYINFVNNVCAFYKCKTELWQAVVNGYLHPGDYGLLEEYAAQQSVDPSFNKEATCVQPVQNIYYNLSNWFITHFKTNEANLATLEANRARLHLQSMAIEKKKRKLQKDLWLQLFFGHVGCRV